MTEIVITAAKRTPVGSFLGAFACTPAHELGRVAIEAALDAGGRRAGRSLRSHPRPGADRRARARTRPARPRWRPACPRKSPPGASTRSAARACAPSRVAAQSIIAGDAAIVVAGGQESMSLSPHAQSCAPARRWATSRSSTR